MNGARCSPVTEGGAEDRPTLSSSCDPDDLDSVLCDIGQDGAGDGSERAAADRWTSMLRRQRSASLPPSTVDTAGRRALAPRYDTRFPRRQQRPPSRHLFKKKGPVSNDGGVGPGGAGGQQHHMRTPLTQAEFLMSYAYHERKSTGMIERTKSVVSSGCRCWCSRECARNMLLTHVPILKWLPEYDFGASIVGDLIAGITVAVMHIPQGMAYAMLSGLPAVNGLYMAFFPVLVYIIFGTSRHNSIGTFAVVLLMTGTVSQELLEKHGHKDPAAQNGTFVPLLPDHGTPPPGGGYTAIQTVALVTFGVGLWEILMGLLRLGALSVLLSDVLVSGFTTGAATHVLTSQLKGIFGMAVPRQNRFPKLLRTHLYVLDHLQEANLYAVIVSGVTMLILAVNNDFIRPRLARKCMVPVPIELIAVVGGTLLSYFLKLNEEYKVPIIGDVPTGLPKPEVPPMELFQDGVLGSLVIAIVAYTTSYSMARIFARRLNYVIDANQELLALGLSTTVGSFFQCGPVAASLSRSLIQESVGGVTQIASVVSAGLILIMLLFLGPYFEPLPTGILSAIIVVSLKGMFTQFADLAKAWQSSKLDALIWVSTFLSVVVVDIDVGLAVGVAVSLLTLLWRNQHAYACTLGEIPRTGIYVDSQRFDAAEEIHNVKVFHYGAGLHFANRDYFREVLFDLTGLDPVLWHEQAMKRLKKEAQERARRRRLGLPSMSSSGGAGAGRVRRLGSSGSVGECCERCPILLWNCCTFCNARARNNGDLSPTSDAAGIFSSDAKMIEGDEDEGGLIGDIEDDNSTEIRDIRFDRRSLSGGVTTGDHLALPASTGLRLLRRASIHVDTTGHPLPFRYLLIDLSGISFIDMAGVKLLKSLVQDYDRINIHVLFAGATEPVLHMFRKMAFSEDVPPQRFFPTVHDGVMVCKHKMVFQQSSANPGPVTPPNGPAALAGPNCGVTQAMVSHSVLVGHGTSTGSSILGILPRPGTAGAARSPGGLPTVCEGDEHLSPESADSADDVCRDDGCS